MDSAHSILKAPCHRNLLSLAKLLPYIQQPGRKDIMTLIRMQVTPSTHYTIAKNLATWDTAYIDFSTNNPIYLSTHVVPLLDQFIFSPIQCGFVSMLLRMIPYYDPDHLAIIRDETLWKEIHATMGPDRPPNLDYSCLFGHHTSSFYIPLNRFSDPNPTLSSMMRTTIQHWKEQLSNRTLLPKIGKKTLGKTSSDNYWRQTGHKIEELPLLPAITPKDLEKTYMKTAGTITGPVEVRIAYKFTDLKPRVYYAQGATSYFASRYIHSIADTFQRLFPYTHPVHRYNPRRVEPLDDDDILFIYDYTSFTSNLAELKYFLHSLASFCEDTVVRILDTHYGLIDINLGEMIHEYNRVINVGCEFDIGFVLESGIPLILQSHKSGLLGVHGNIVWSTSLHGLNLCHLCGSVDGCNCIGDDAEGKIRKQRGNEAKTRLVAGVRELGDISEEKMRWWMENSKEPNRSGHHYVKRPIDRIEGKIWTRPMIDFPSLALVVDVASKYHTVPFEDYINRARKFIVQTCRFLDQIAGIFSHYQTDLDPPLILDYLRWAYTRLKLPKKGCIPGQWTGDHMLSFQDLACPKLIMESMEDWRQVLWDNYGSQASVMQVPVTKESSDLSQGFRAGDELVSTGSALLGVLEGLDIVVKERRLVEERFFQDGIPYALFTMICDGDFPFLYTYSCLEDSPSWVADYFR